MSFSKVLHWFVISSADPSSVSLTLKGILTTAIPVVLAITGLAHIQLDGSMLTAVADAFVQLINAALVTAGIAITLYGMVRKLILTITGRNEAAKEIINGA